MSSHYASTLVCTCGCGAPLRVSDYGPVCTCSCAAEAKAATLAQQIHELRLEREAIERRLCELIEASLYGSAA